MAATDPRFRQDDLTIEATDRADDGVLDAFYAAYDKAFVLANEKEAFEGFRDCLALNSCAVHQRLRARHGPFRELVMVARDDAGAVVGGANLIVVQQADLAAHGIGHTVNLNYLFVAPAQRGSGRSRTLLDACHRLAESTTAAWRSGANPKSLFFLEINDPFRLTPEQYTLDSEHAGIDQVTRLDYWARMGAMLLDWPYVQPALSADQQDDRTLAYAVLDAGTDRLPASLVLWHLERFFAISVLKGADLQSSPSAWQQVRTLQRLAAAGTTLPLLDFSAAADTLRAQLTRSHDRPPSLRAALGGHGDERAATG